MADWFQRTISRYPELVVEAKEFERDSFAESFDRVHDRVVQPVFLWFVYKARALRWEAGQGSSEWRMDGTRSASVWLRVGRQLQQMTITGCMRQRQVRCGASVAGVVPGILATACDAISEEQVADRLERFLDAVLAAEARGADRQQS